MSSFYVLRVLSCLGQWDLSWPCHLVCYWVSVHILFGSFCLLFLDQRETAIVPLGMAPFESFCVWWGMGLI